MSAKPFLRWAGGKRWLAARLAPLLTARLRSGGTYLEPFLGSGAMFFAVGPSKAVLSDQNEALIRAFRQVARHPRAIRNRLSQMAASATEYQRVRRQSSGAELEHAVRFIYLNRNCWGGLYRENKSGVFNVPYGGKDRNHLGLCSNGLLAGASAALRDQSVELTVCDFETTVNLSNEKDVVYCDPTYREVTRAQFDRYGKSVFSWSDQERLSRLALAAYKRGALVLVSNTTSGSIRDLYPEAAVLKVRRPKGLAPSSEHANLAEYLFILDPRHDWPSWSCLGHLRKPSS